MKEHPVIFSAPMVQAILAGRKTQTRRIIHATGPFLGLLKRPLRSMKQERVLRAWFGGDSCSKKITSRFGEAGHKLWVRENWWKIPVPTFKQLREGADTWPKIAYDADENEITRDQNREMGWKLKPSIHMPRWGSRITLDVIDVCVERLQDISEADARKEGIKFCHCNRWTIRARGGRVRPVSIRIGRRAVALLNFGNRCTAKDRGARIRGSG